MLVMFYISAVLLILANFTATSSLSDVATYRETSFELEHFLNEKFTGRSSYIIKHQRDGNHEINLVDSSKNSISMSQLPEFKALLANKELYRIQVIFNNEDGTTTSASTAVPVCDLQQSGFKEDIVLHLDDNIKLMSVSYSSPAMAISQACNPNKTRINIAAAEVSQAVPLQALGPKPPTLSHINFGAEADPNAQPHQSFLRQYWYILLPMAIVVMMGGGNGEEPAK